MKKNHNRKAIELKKTTILPLKQEQGIAIKGGTGTGVIVNPPKQSFGCPAYSTVSGC